MGPYERIKGDEYEYDDDEKIGRILLVDQKQKIIRSRSDDDHHKDVELGLNAKTNPSATPSVASSSLTSKLHHQQKQQQRLISLDVFRGLTVAVILLLLPFIFIYFLKNYLFF